MLNIDAWSWLFILIDLLIIYFVLRKLLWKPVTAYMEKRTNTISESIDQSKKMFSEAEQLKAEYQTSLNNARIESAKIIEDSRTRAQQEYNLTLEAAIKDSEALKVRSREEMKLEREEMFATLKSEIAGLALAAASKVIESNMNTEKNKEIVNSFIDKEGAA